MTRTDLETRLAALRQERLQVQANLYAYDGAIQECEYWLARCQAKDDVSPDREAGPHVLRTA